MIMDRKTAEKLENKPQNSIPENSEDLKKAEVFSDEYCNFIGYAKTERLAVDFCIKEAEKHGFKPLEPKKKLNAGDKVYYSRNNKCICLAVIGKKGLNEGAKIIASHIDSPRLDLKPSPLYEASGISYFKTHYYGGLKKYQWTAMPLQLVGVIYRQDGTKIDINIGSDKDDPVFYISDLMPHIGKDQMSKNASEFIPGENLNIINGSVPFDKDGGVKLNILSILNKKYGIDEKDLTTAEISAVPAYEPREVGFDRSMIAAYGHDDKICAYPAFRAMLDEDVPEKTSVLMLADKEEIGSYGITGLGSETYIDFIADLCEATNADFRLAKRLSLCLSADVGGAFDPTFADAYEANNSSYINRGVVISKYTGSRGKGGCSDATAETFARVAHLFEKNNVIWQSGEYGKVDQGGAGTVASEIAKFGIEVIDCGVPLLSMHSPVELASKYDIYEMYKASKVFFAN